MIHTTHRIALTVLALAMPLVAFAGEAPTTVETSPATTAPTSSVPKGSETPPTTSKSFEAAITLQSLYLVISDTDFDPSESLYEPDGQSVGGFATYFSPYLTWHATEAIELVYEAEVGVNVWSTHDPDQQDPTGDDVMLLKHRQIYTKGAVLGGGLFFKVGYQRLMDPTGLFTNHWMGAATVGADLDWLDVGVTVGQTPDPTYEGVTITETNFEHDTMVAGITAHSDAIEGLDLSLGLWTLDDTRRIGKPLRLLVPMAAVGLEKGPLSLKLGVVFQLGTFEGAAMGGGDQTHFAWATQLEARLDLSPVKLAFNVLALSPDDEHAQNADTFAFLYSGKSTSATIMLSEDEHRDRWDNLDERLAVSMGGFYLTRPGLLLADMKASVDLMGWLQPSIILGYARVLEPKNTLDESFAGFEAILGLRFYHGDVLAFDVMGGVLVPGGAAASMINAIDRSATEVQYLGQALLTVQY